MPQIAAVRQPVINTLMERHSFIINPHFKFGLLIRLVKNRAE